MNSRCGPENEYEQQRIHYVHVLDDLQVATAGVFDPAPYMTVPAEPLPDGEDLRESVGGLAVPNPKSSRRAIQRA